MKTVTTSGAFPSPTLRRFERKTSAERSKRVPKSNSTVSSCSPGSPSCRRRLAAAWESRQSHCTLPGVSPLASSTYSTAHSGSATKSRSAAL